MRNRISSVQYSLGLAAVLLAGCFGQQAPEFEGTLHPVVGTVTVNGAPAAGVQITYIPTGETPGTGAAALSDSEGKFTLRHRSGQEGIEAGNYKVTFSQVTKADGSQVLPEEDAAIVGVERLPARYTALETTDITAEVPAGGKSFNFDLKSP